VVVHYEEKVTHSSSRTQSGVGLSDDDGVQTGKFFYNSAF
jgi:hypothetical protein